MTTLSSVEGEPLARLLGGVHEEVFTKQPDTIGLRDLQRQLAATLSDLRGKNEYRVLTNRGAPAFLLIPLDPTAWVSLLAVAPPDTPREIAKAEAMESEGAELPDLDAVLATSPSP